MSLRKGLIIFILSAFGVGAVIIFKSVDKNTIHSLLAANKLKLLLAFLIVVCAWICDAGRFCALARAAHEHVSFPLGLILNWLNYFGCAVTPMQSGGGPFQVYVLYKKGIPVGKGVAITLMRTMLTILILTLAVPVALMLDPDILGSNSFMKGLVFYAFIIILVMWGVVFFTIMNPAFIKKISRIIVMWLTKFKFFQSKRRVIKIVQFLDNEIDNYILNFKIAFHSGKFWVLVAVLFTALHLLLLFTILPVLMSALGLPFRYFQTIAVQSVFTFILYFVPTPGASGFAEGGGALLYSILMPENMAGVVSIMCRFFTDYISILMGIIVVIKMLGWGVSENLHKGASVENVDSKNS